MPPPNTDESTLMSGDSESDSDIDVNSVSDVNSATDDDDDDNLSVEEDAEEDEEEGLENAADDEEEDGDEYGDDDEEETDDSGNCLQKFDDETRKNMILNYHPETISHTAEEIQCWSRVTRDQFNDIVDELHQTTPLLSKFERTRVLGLRTRQLNSGAPPYIDVPRTIINNYLIASMELEQKKLPFIIQRPLANGQFEYWNVNDLELLYM